MKQRLSRLTGVIAAVAVALTMGVVTASTASADPECVGPDYSLIGDRTHGSLTIHKFVYGSTSGMEDQNGNPVGRPVDDNGIVIPGVEFTVWQVPDIDLTTNQGWLDAVALTLADVLAMYAAGDLILIGSEVTNADGYAYFPNLPLGLYLVRETDAPTGVVQADLEFLITVPTTFRYSMLDDDECAEWASWIFDVHVWPKNEVEPPGIDKDVENIPSIDGQDILFTIRADIPIGAMNGFWIADMMDDRLELDELSVVAYLVEYEYDNGDWVPVDPPVAVALDFDLIRGLPRWVPGEREGGVACAPGYETITAGHWVIDVDAAGDYNNWVLDFEDSLDELEDVHSPYFRVHVMLEARILESGVLINETALFPNGPDSGYDLYICDPPDLPGDEVVVKYGDLTVTKKSAVDPNPVLAGMNFQLFYYIWTETSDATTAVFGNASQVVLDGVYQWVTNADGYYTVQGLRASNWANNATIAQNAVGWVQYWLVEVIAPEGFELLAQPHPFVILYTAGLLEDGDGNPVYELGLLDNAEDIYNAPWNAGFELPETGGIGTTILYVAGGAILVAGLLLLVTRRRKADAAA